MSKPAQNLFDSAKVVEIKAASTANDAKNKTREVSLGDKLDYLAAINALTKSLESVQKVYYNEVTTAMIVDFTDESMRLKKRPDNFKGLGPNSEASCQMKKRSSRSYLNDEEVAILKENKIKYDDEIISEEIPERFFINPDIVNDSSLAQKISEKLSEIPELSNKEILMKQAKREKVVRSIVSEDSFDQIAQLSDKDLVKRLLSIVSTWGVNSKLTTQDLDQVLEIVRKSGVKL